ncbi:MAG: BTAD domain-containing putative transcriptional regulator [Acidimicrobiia bacterium]
MPGHPSVEVRVLGPIEIVVDGTTRGVTGNVAPRLLAVLARSAGQVVQIDRIVDALWRDEPPANEANALQAQVSKLRRLLPAGAISHQGRGYSLDVPTDVQRFEQLLADDRHDLALQLWRGAPFGGLDDLELIAEASRLEQLRMQALERWLGAEIAAGRHAEAAAQLEVLTATHPTHERLWALRMTALYGAGRQADALQAYQDARTVLVEQLGLEPGPELRAAEAAVLAHDPALSTAAPPPRRPTLGNLPVDANRLVGRAREIEAIAALLGRHRLVTLIGPGGAGKTRLALAVARTVHPAAGAWFVDLAGVHDGSGLETLVAGILGVRAARDPSRTDPDFDAVTQLVELIDDRQLLLVLDNCEHVIDAAAKLADALLRACQGLTMLATSREGLAIGAEALWPVPPLDAHDAAELFVERASALVPGFAAEGVEDREVIEDLCQRLDGLPLAIELAAARVRLLGPRELRDRLDDRFRLLTGGSRAALARQQTLRAVVDWSYDLLDESERRLFERLAVFAAAWTLEAAEALAGEIAPDRATLEELVGRLVDKSLVVPLHSDGGRRFRLLQTLAFYGRERLAERPEAAAVRDRHAAWFADVAAAGADGVRSGAQRAWLDRIDAELDDLRAAVDWAVASGSAETALRLAAGMSWPFWLRNELQEARRWCSMSLGLDGGSTAQRALTMAWYHWAGLQQHDPVMALSGMTDALALAEESGDPHTIGLASLLAANVLGETGDRSGAQAVLARADEMFVATGDRWGRGIGNILRAIDFLSDGDRPAALAVFDDALALMRDIGDPWAQALCLSTRASVHEQEGDYAAARSDLAAAQQLFEEVGGGGYAIVALARLGNLAVLEGDLDEADRLHREAMCDAANGLVGELQGHVLMARAFSLRRRGDLDAAAEVLDRALGLRRVKELTIGLAFGSNSRGFVAEQQGDADGAERYHLMGLRAAVGGDDRRAVALALEGLAGVARLRGDPARAGFLLGAADALRRITGGPLPAGERYDVDRIESSAVAAIGPDEFRAAFGAGGRAQLDGLVHGLLAEASDDHPA